MSATTEKEENMYRHWICHQTFLRLVILFTSMSTASYSQAAESQPSLDKQTAPKVVRYGDFGATGDGITNDMAAICQAHEFANQHGLPVKAEDNATYYIGGENRTAIIQTNTDFGSARFMIDDTQVENRSAHIFRVTSTSGSFPIGPPEELRKNQQSLQGDFSGLCLVVISNRDKKHFIRYGANQNSGTSQCDVILVDESGKLDPATPLVWDFERVSKITGYPVDAETLTISGGRFTTIANSANSKYHYYNRGIGIERSRVVIDGVEHRIIKEGDQGAPYGGFLNIHQCAFVEVRNCLLTGHKTYRTIGAAGRPVSMGTYDLTINRAVNVSLIHCQQSNDILDSQYWGVMGTNFCKNLLLDHCKLSRFDAHMGVANATIRNSTLGHAGINAIGFGKLVVENSTLHGRSLINLRPDYGSTWWGEFEIRNCVFVPAGGRSTSSSLIGGSNSGQHDFGYHCSMPSKITIDSLRIEDSNHPRNYQGPALFANFNKQIKEDRYVEKFPYRKTEVVRLKNVTTASGKELRLSDNPVMFQDVRVDRH